MNRLRGTSERRIRPVGRPRRCVPGVQALEARQLLANFAFDPDGPGPLTPTSIDPSGLIGGFDFSVGNALAQGAVTAIGQKLADPAGPNPQFQILYQATLAGFINPGGTTVGAPGLNGMPASAAPFQITVLASITEELLSYDAVMGTAIFRVAPDQAAGSFYRIYFHTGATDAEALTANNLTGAGFTDGTMVLSGVPVGGSGSEGLFNLNMVPGTNPPTPVVGPFDQFGADNAAGRLTIVGNGAAAIPVRVEQINPSWFLTPITNLSFNTTANTPFLTTNPSAVFSTVVGGAYTTVTPDLGPINGSTGADFQTSADANASTRQSSLRLVKSVNGIDANTPPGPNIPVGAPVNYTYTVTNTGEIPLTGVTITDDNGTPGAPGDDFVPAPILAGGFNSGDLDQDGRLDPGETWNFAGPSKFATAGVTTNLATASATDAFGSTITDSDPASYNGVAVVSPGIQVVKFVNGQDANTPPGPNIPVGAPVDYTYAVTNIGNQPLTGITLVDDNGTPANPGDDFAPAPILAGGFNTGDLNQNGTLDPGETWNYAGPSKFATLGVTTNLVTASGTDPFGTTVSDSDPASYNGVAVVSPGIQVVKFVNGVDANTPPGPDVPVGAPVDYTYAVTNIGNQPLTGITLVDDNGTPANPGDDFAPAPVLAGGFNTGDLNQNGTLDPGETWNYTGPSKTATLGVTTNIVTATGTAPGGTTVSDSDPASYNGVAVVTPGLRIVKFVNGQDANTPPGINIPVGAPVNYTYAVTNTGDVSLTNITIVDDNGTPANPADDFAPAPILAGGFNTGDLNQNGTLDPGETWNYAGPSKTATLGVTTNIATATGVAPGGTVVSNSDPASYNGVSPALRIALAKQASGLLLTTVDSLVRMGYHDQHTRIVLGFTAPLDAARAQDLRNYTLVLAGRDGRFGTADDRTARLLSAVYDPTLRTVTLKTADKLALNGRYRLTVNCDPPTGLTNAAGVPVDGDDNGLPGGAFVREFGRDAFRLNLNRVVQTVDTTGAVGPLVNLGDPVTFSYQVTNPGVAPLAITRFVDNAGTPSDPADDFTPTYVGGDTNGNGLVDPTETWRYIATRAAGAGQYTNTATVTAGSPNVPPGTTVSASATANAFGVVPTVNSLERWNYHNQSTLVVIGYNGPLSVAAASNPALYEIVGPNQQRVGITRVSVDPLTRTVTLVPAARLNIHHVYRVTARSPFPGGPTFSGTLAGSGSLASPFPRPLPPIATVARTPRVVRSR